jgi:EAL domain-containing protein (putative c-di-GMP-specific phosphodiesterase class I)
VAGADSDESARAGLAVALEAAHRLKVRPVATGLGSKDEWNLLYAWGCRSGEGPFVAPPMAAAAVAPWLQRWQARQGMSA